jgi:carbon monoxide dehydrogenase subunit G
MVCRTAAQPASGQLHEVLCGHRWKDLPVQLEHSFTVPVGIDAAWKTLLDVETIAPCMPGAALDTVDGDAFTGTVKVKLGPIGLTYKGKASFVEKDETAHRAVIDAQGRDARGNGTASAVVTAVLTEKAAGSTEVVVVTDLNITGKPAQIGRGVMVDVGNKLIGQFADCLSGKLTAGDVLAAPAPTAATPSDTGLANNTGAKHSSPAALVTDSAPEPAPTTSAVSRPRPNPAEVVPIDLLGSAGPAVAKRLIPVVGGVVALVLAFLLGRRSR